MYQHSDPALSDKWMFWQCFSFCKACAQLLVMVDCFVADAGTTQMLVVCCTTC